MELLWFVCARTKSAMASIWAPFHFLIKAASRYSEMRWSQFLQNLKYFSKCAQHIQDFLPFEGMQGWCVFSLECGFKMCVCQIQRGRETPVVCRTVYVWMSVCVSKEMPTIEGPCRTQGPQPLATTSSPSVPHWLCFHYHSGRNNKGLMCGCVVF